MNFLNSPFLIGLFLFLGSALQQISLQYTDIANAAFFTIFYVPMVPIIVFFLFRDKIHWSNWPSVILCLIGGYLLTNFYDATVRKGDALVILGAIFWALHIIYVGKVIKNFNLPILIGLIQTLVVSVLSIIGAITFEEINIDGVFKHTYQIFMLVFYLVDLLLFYRFMLKKILHQHQQLLFFFRRCYCDHCCMVFIESNTKYK